MSLQEIRDKIYSSDLYERLIILQGKTVSKWQTQLLRVPLYWRWHSLKYNNAIHWLVLLSFTTGMFFGIMSPFTAGRQPGRGQELELQTISTENSTVLAYPNLLTANGEDKSEIEITLLDENLNPIKNRHLEFEISGEGVKVSQSDVYTSTNGVAYTYLTSDTPGNKILSVRDISTGEIIEKTVLVKFSENIVEHWVKPGEIGVGGAESVELETAGDSIKWHTDAILSPAKIEEFSEKSSNTADSCTIIGDEVYCSGGSNNQEQTDDFYKLNLQTKEFTSLAPIPLEISNHKIGSLSQNIYLFGGTVGTETVGMVYQYSLDSETWVRINDMPIPLSNFDLSYYNEHLIISGGYNGKTQSEYVYDFDGYTWTSVPIMYRRRNFSSSVVINGVIYTFGGWDGEKVLASSEKHAIGTTKWEYISQLPQPRWGHSAINIEDKIYIFGGYNSNSEPISTIDIYDIASDSWQESSLNFTCGNSSVTSHNNEVIILGGDIEPNQIYSFIPQRNSIRISENQNIRRADRPSMQISIQDENASGKIIEREIDTLDLSDVKNLNLLLYSSKPGDVVHFLFGENSALEQEFTINFEKAYLWEEKEIGISNVAKSERDEVKYLGFRISDASEPFNLNIYDIWTEKEFYPDCPCSRLVKNIYFEKSPNQNWGEIYWSSKESETSRVLLSYRTSDSKESLEEKSWDILASHNALENNSDLYLEIAAELLDEKDPSMPQLETISVEITEE